MTHFPQSSSAKRATRVEFGGSVPVAIRSEASGTVRAKLQVLSTTGGLFVIAKPLEAGDFVQVTFQTSQGAVRGMAEILQPTRKSTLGCLQPFRFVALDDADHARLRRVMELQLDKTTIDIHNRLAVTATEALKSTRHNNGWRPVEAVLHGKTRSSGR